MFEGRDGEAGGAPLGAPLLPSGGQLRAMALPFAEWDRRNPWRRSTPLTVFRAGRRTELDGERSATEEQRARLDWNAFVAADTNRVSAGSPRTDALSMEEVRARVKADGFASDVAAARILAESGRLAALPDAAGYKAWSDEQIARLRHDPEELPDGFDPFADLDRLSDGDGIGGVDEDEAEPLEAHPLNWACESVDTAQQALREAEAARVHAALAAWRVAEASVTGTVDAAINGSFWKSTMLQLANSLQVAETTASGMVHAAMDLERAMPITWGHFIDGRIPWRGMQIAHARLDGLDEAFWSAFDAKAAIALTTIAMPKMKDELHRIRERVQASTAVERAKQALSRMSVTIEPLDDGLAALTIVAPAAEIISIDLRLDLAAREAASAEGETRSIGQLRAHIALDLFDEGLFRGATPDLEGIAVPVRRGVQCKVGLLIPAMTALGHSDAPAELEGYGPIDIDTAKRLAGDATSWIKVLSDPISGAVIDIGRDKYRPTADMRAMLGFLDRGGRGPNSARPPSQTEADHLIPFNQGLHRGRTALDNLVLLARRDHRIKTSGLWDIELRLQRELAWTSFFGTRIITRVEPLEPTPVPTEFRSPRTTPIVASDWADDDAEDSLNYPF